MAARLPARPAGLRPGLPLRARLRPEPGRLARRAGRRLRTDLRGGRIFLTSQLSGSRWLDLGAFRWRDLAIGQAIRASVGVLTPLAIGIGTGQVAYGSYAALGALPAGYVAFRGVSRTRVLAVLIAALGMAVSTFVGAVVAATHPWLLVPIVFAWAYAAGLLASLGPAALAVTLQWPVALLIASAIPLSPGDAALRAGLVLAGGLWQCLLVVSSWTVNRGSAERVALARSCLTLARYATDAAAGQAGPPAPGQLTGTSVLADPNPLMRTAVREHMTDLAEEAERIRTTLTALAASGQTDRSGRWRRPGAGRPGTGRPGPAGARPVLGTTADTPPDTASEPAGTSDMGSTASEPAGTSDMGSTASEPAGTSDMGSTASEPAGTSDMGSTAGVLAGTGEVLTELAESLISARPGPRADHLAAARRALAGISAQPGASWQWAADALLGQLRAACRITERLNHAEQPPISRHAPPAVERGWIRDAFLTVRASIGTSSEAGRHALRLAVVSAIADVIVRASGLGHGYWAVLTVFIVLRPDYSSTLYRGLQRASGTVVGAGLGVCTVLLAKVSLSALLVGVAVSLVAAYSVFTVNYLLYAVFLTDFVVVLLALLGLPPEPTALARLVGTCVGTGLAVLAYLLWPTWQGTSAAEKFAALADDQGHLVVGLLRAYTRPGEARSGRLRQLQLAARRSRLDAEAAADRLAGEPDRGPIDSSTVEALRTVGHRNAQTLLTLVAIVAAHHSRPQPPVDPAFQSGLDAFAASVDLATGQVAAALRDLGAGGGGPAQLSIPPLRAEHAALWPDQADPASEAAGLVAATDSLVDAVNTAADVLRRAMANPA